MKKLITLFFFVLLGTFTSNAQILFEEDFQGGSFNGFTLTDVDGLTVDSWLSEFTEAWIIGTDNNDLLDLSAKSTSFYSPAGTSDDWMATPSITLSSSGNYLTWQARAKPISDPDGYEVWVSTLGPTPADLLSGTMVFSVTDESTSDTSHLINLDAFANQTVYIGFRNNSTDGYILLIDDIKVSIKSPIDAELTAITTYPYIAGPTGSNVDFEVTNSGLNQLTSFEAEWTDGTNTYSQTFSANIPPLGTASFTFNDQLSVAPGSDYTINVTITDVNGAGPDGNQTNDVGSTFVSGVTFIPTKMVVGEEGTGTWCGWCPRGWDFMYYMDSYYSDNWIGIAVHNNDPMTDVEYDALMSPTISGFPGGHVDRARIDDDPTLFDVDPVYFEEAFNQRISLIPPADISVNLVMNGDTAEITIIADFAASILGDFRLNCVVTENGIQNDSYDQVNYYNAGMDPFPGFGYPWDGMSNPVLGSQMIYNNVARAILGGWSGEAGSVPSSVNSGQQISYTWSYVIPNGSSVNRMNFIGMLIDQSTGEIVNAGKSDHAAGLTEESKENEIFVYPNPALTEIHFTTDNWTELTIYSLDGRLIRKEKFQQSLDVSDLKKGEYILEIQLQNGEIQRCKLIK